MLVLFLLSASFSNFVWIFAGFLFCIYISNM